MSWQLAECHHKKMLADTGYHILKYDDFTGPYHV